MIENSQKIHDTIKVTKIIIDTVRVSSKDSMDLLSRMDTFYNNSWMKLVWVVTTAFAVIGLLVPALIQFYQNKQLRLSEINLKKEIAAEVEKALTELKEKIQIESDAQFVILRAELKAVFYITQANMFATRDHPHKSAYYFMQAMEHSFVAEKKANVSNIFSPLIYNLKNSDKTQLDETFEEHGCTFSELLTQIKKHDAEEIFSSRIKEIENIYKNLTKSTVE